MRMVKALFINKRNVYESCMSHRNLRGAPYQPVADLRPAFLASYLLQPAAIPVTQYGNIGHIEHKNRHIWCI